MLRTIYLTDNGVLLKKKSNRIILKKENKVLEEIPVLDLKRVLIFGNNQVSTELMRFLAGKGIEVAFLSGHGKFMFRLVPETSKNIFLRLAQHERYRDPAYRRRLGQVLVEAKLKNQRSVLIRYQRNQPRVDLNNSIEFIKKCSEEVFQKEDVEEIRGMEGIASKTFFEAYGRLLQGGFQFIRREYYPPPDPVNALLSFGYMLLFNEITSLLEASGFDVFLGFLHGLRYGRASLATDMIEELRSPVIDRLVLYLVNKGVIKPDQFGGDKEKKVKMTDEARKSFLMNYEKFMTAPFLDKGDNKNKTYRNVLGERVKALELSLLENVEYRPYYFYS